jgi:hypothetical protein
MHFFGPLSLANRHVSSAFSDYIDLCQRQNASTEKVTAMIGIDRKVESEAAV